jgi:multidrug resistance efflux pump
MRCCPVKYSSAVAAATTASRPSARRQGSALNFVILAIALIGGGAMAVWWLLGGNESAVAPTDLITTTVSRGPFEFVVSEQGTVENATNIELKCEVKSRGGPGSGMTIISVVPEGTHVEAGDVVVELDASALEQERLTQLIAVTGQKALLVQAENKLAAAQIARQEYEQGTFLGEERLLIADEYLTQQTYRNAESALEQTRRLFARAVVTAKQVESAQSAVEDTRNRWLAAQTKLDALRQHTRQKMLKTFDSDIATATADMAAQQGKLTLEERKLKEIEDQIAKCTIRAPVAGEVVHANEYDSNNGQIETDFVVQAGAVVRERQAIVRLPNSNEMQVRATVNQARVTLVRAGMPATIRIDALKDKVIRGEVTKVNPYADPSSWMSGNIKRYACYIKVFDPPPDLRSGMVADVRMQIEQHDNALQVPVQALAQHKGRFFSLVKNGESYETRQVEIRSTNDKVATIASGLAEGEVVVMTPRQAGGLLELPDLPDPKPVQVAGGKRPDDGAKANTPPEPAGG